MSDSKIQATYCAKGWKDKRDCTVANENSDGTVDLADAGGVTFVTGLPVYSGEGDKPGGSFAIVGEEVDNNGDDESSDDESSDEAAALVSAHNKVELQLMATELGIEFNSKATNAELAALIVAARGASDPE
jgi:hypothetical protein